MEKWVKFHGRYIFGLRSIQLDLVALSLRDESWKETKYNLAINS